MISFTVYGEPKSQGSTRVVPVRKKGGGYATREDGRPKLIPVHDNGKALKSWRAEVVSAFQEVYQGEPLDGPVHLYVTLYRPRPKSHFTSKGGLKPTAPIKPTTRPDTLKLVRGIEDALTGHAWRDDSQIVFHVLSKCYGDTFCTAIKIDSVDIAP